MTAPTKEMTGAEMVVQALIDQGVKHVFGYPGGAILPVDHALEDEEVREKLQYFLVRHEQGAVHAAEGYARSSGKVGVVIVTSGPGITNCITGLTDAFCDSIPIVCISGQVPTQLIGNDAFQECDAVGITRPCTKYNYLVKNIADLPRVLHEAFHLARTGRPGPVHIDLPKDIQFAKGLYTRPAHVGTDRFRPNHEGYHPKVKGDPEKIMAAIKLMEAAKRPLFYTGGGVVNSGREASEQLCTLVKMTGFPITSTLMGLGAYPASGERWLGMLGMHGTVEANMAMHDCDVMICVGARFDDRITGRLDAFSPHSKKIHIDIDPSSINKNIIVDIGIVGDCGSVLEDMVQMWRSRNSESQIDLSWYTKIHLWQEKTRRVFDVKNANDVIKPQYAIKRLYDLTNDRDTYITTEVGQHQMWAAQFYGFQAPRRFMTSGGLGTMGYGTPAAIGAQVAHPRSLVINIAGDMSVKMMIQELETAVQYGLPIKILIINNSGSGMVVQWQHILHQGREAHSRVSGRQTDFVKLAEAYGAYGLRCEKPGDIDMAIKTMIETPGPVILDVIVDENEQCFPMIPSGRAHNKMILGNSGSEPEAAATEEGKALV